MAETRNTVAAKPEAPPAGPPRDPAIALIEELHERALHEGRRDDPLTARMADILAKAKKIGAPASA